MTINGVDFEKQNKLLDGRVLRSTLCRAEGRAIAKIIELGVDQWAIYLIGRTKPQAIVKRERIAREMIAELYASQRGNLWDTVKRLADRDAPSLEPEPIKPVGTT